MPRPRRVKGGIRLDSLDTEFPGAWWARRWLDAVLRPFDDATRREGLEYAARGQTRRLDIEPARVSGAVQGVRQRPYEPRASFRPLDHEQWELVTEVLLNQAVFAAKLLTNELPVEIDAALTQRGVTVFPDADDDPAWECECPAPNGRCVHAACLAFLVAERLAAEPFLLFTLRGMRTDDLLASLRQHRLRAGAPAAGGALVYTPSVPALDNADPGPVLPAAGAYWSLGSDLDAIDLPVEPPSASHPLLRRLGASPFTSSTFPMVGLLATCYDVISASVLRPIAGDAEPSAPPTADPGSSAQAAEPDHPEPGSPAMGPGPERV